MRKGIAVLMILALLFSSISVFYGSNADSSGNVPATSAAVSSPNVSGSNTATVAFNNSTGSSTPFQASLSNISSNASSSGLSSRYLYLPSESSSITYSDGHVQPYYSNSPAPMGIADFGLQNNSGKITGYEYNTSSFEGTLALNNSSAFYLENDAPNSFSVQLNTVLTGVTLSGNSSYMYWMQNVASYSTRTHTLSLVNNIWNFTSANATMNNSTIAYSSGTTYNYPGVYIALGPQINVTFPFTLKLYLNSTIVNSNDAAYFNYSILFPNGTVKSGTYDMVEFNSAGGQSPGYQAAPAMLTVNGNKTAPNGLLLDSEFVIGGPGGGSTSTFYSMNGSMNLYYLDSGHNYKAVPSAYDFGTDTGETSTGIAESYSSSGTVKLSAGPSILFGMWNTASSSFIKSYRSGSVTYSGTVSPSNGFMFVSTGTDFLYTNASWVPLNSSGSYSFSLPGGSYMAIEMMSMHTPEIFSLSSGPTAMPYNAAEGIYTPLVAMDNQQLANISASGDGSASNPYVLYSSQYASDISPLFSQINDYTYPEFSGILLYNIADHVTISSMPSFTVKYLPSYHNYLTGLGLPLTNNLNTEIYGSTNISFQGNNHITGWFSSAITGAPVANLVIWNSTGINVTDNIFDSLGSSILIYNSNSTYSNDTIAGNTFAIDYTSYYEFTPYYAYGYYDYGIQLYSSNNTIYNNYFATIFPVYSPSYDIYTGSYNVTYENFFSHPSAGTNIIGGRGTGGNYWMNYIGYSNYTDYGYIAGSGDSSPLTYASGANISASGIYPDTPWEIIVYRVESLGGMQSLLASLESVQGVNANYSLPNGTYDYVAAADGQYFETYGNFTVNGNFLTLNTTFQSNTTYNVTFRASGLPSGKNWYVSLDNVGIYTSDEYVTYIGVPNGTYNFTAISEGMSVFPSGGNISVSGRPVYVSLSMTPDSFNLTFRESGLPAGTKWAVNIEGFQESTNTGMMSFNVTNGTYSYTVSQISGYSAVSGGKIQVNNSNATVYITYTPVHMPFPAEAVLLSLATGLIAGSIVMYLLFRRRT